MGVDYCNHRTVFGRRVVRVRLASITPPNCSSHRIIAYADLTVAKFYGQLACVMTNIRENVLFTTRKKRGKNFHLLQKATMYTWSIVIRSKL